MNFVRSPRNKLLAATAILLVLAVLAPIKGINAATAARVVLGIAAVGGMLWWFLKQKKQDPASFSMLPQLKVLSRAGLSQRCGLALVEADGRNYLVVYGDGFAEVTEAASARKPRPATRRRVSHKAPSRKAGAL